MPNREDNMAKIQANTISGAGMSNVRAPYTPPEMATGRLGAAAGPAGAAIAAGVRPYDAMNANIERQTRQKIANGDARTREMQGALKSFAGGATALLGGIGKVMERRADEQAEAELSNYTRHLMAGEAEDFATPVTGDLTPDLSDERQKDAINGPYRAVARRIADYNETDGYKALSSRARERFEEKRRKVDDHFLGRALTQDIAAREQLRDAQRAEEARTKTDLATRQALDAGDETPGRLLELAEDAIDFTAKEMARRMRAVTPDGEIVPGAEAVYEGVRQKASDAVYMDIWSKMAQAYAASDDEFERNALRRKMLSMVGAKSGHDVRELLGKDERERYDEAVKAAKESGAPDVELSMSAALKASAAGMPFSDEAARMGWDLWQKAERQLDARLERQRAQLRNDAEQLEYAIFAGTVEGDPFDASMKASEMRSRLPAQDQDALKEKVAEWGRARALKNYSQRVLKLWQSDDPDTQKAEADAILAELKQSDDPELVSRVQSILAGALPKGGAGSVPKDVRSGAGSGEKYSSDEARLILRMLDKSGPDALSQVSKWYLDGDISRATYEACANDVRDDRFRGVDHAAVARAIKAAGIDVTGLLVTGEDGMTPLLDKAGRLQLADPDGTTRSVVGYNWTDWKFQKRRLPASADWARKHEGFYPVYREIGNGLLLRLYEVCAEYQRMQKIGGENRMPLGAFVKEQLGDDLEHFEEARLRANLDAATKDLEAQWGRAYFRGRTTGYEKPVPEAPLSWLPPVTALDAAADEPEGENTEETGRRGSIWLTR